MREARLGETGRKAKDRPRRVGDGCASPDRFVTALPHPAPVYRCSPPLRPSPLPSWRRPPVPPPLHLRPLSPALLPVPPPAARIIARRGLGSDIDPNTGRFKLCRDDPNVLLKRKPSHCVAAPRAFPPSDATTRPRGRWLPTLGADPPILENSAPIDPWQRTAIPDRRVLCASPLVADRVGLRWRCLSRRVRGRECAPFPPPPRLPATRRGGAMRDLEAFPASPRALCVPCWREYRSGPLYRRSAPPASAN